MTTMFKIQLVNDAKQQIEILEEQLDECRAMQEIREADEIVATIKWVNQDHRRNATKLWIRNGSQVGETIVIGLAIELEVSE